MTSAIISDRVLPILELHCILPWAHSELGGQYLRERLDLIFRKDRYIDLHPGILCALLKSDNRFNDPATELFGAMTPIL